MTTREALLKFYQFNRLNLYEDMKAHCVPVYIGCILAPVPNINARKKYIVYHDLHHIITGYGIDRIGESEVSAWELGTGTIQRPIIMIMNLFALSTGFILKPKRVFKAYLLGCRSKNIYNEIKNPQSNITESYDLHELKSKYLECRKAPAFMSFRLIEFGFYLIISMLIHIAMLVLGKSLLIAESIKLKLIPVK